MPHAPRSVSIGLIGWGTVGGGVVELLRRDAALFRERCGLDLRLKTIVTRNPQRARAGGAPEGCVIGDDIRLITQDPEIQAVCHLVGGTDEAKTLLEACLEAGKPVITANKALLAEHGDDLFALAHRRRAAIAFEAAVAGGIPVIAALRDGLVANRLGAIHAILNGTCNYILTRMEADGASYADALAEAQRLGYAELDPTLDVDGHDTAHKLAILARIAIGRRIPVHGIRVEGIRHLTAADIRSAQTMGYRIKLVATAVVQGDRLDLHVAPTLVPLTHPLAAVMGSANGVLLHASAAGPTLLTGAGAGALPTASAVLADVVDVVTGRYRHTADHFAFLGQASVADLVDPGDERTGHYARFTVADRPGVLAGIAGALSRNGVSVSSVHQRRSDATGTTAIEVITHPAPRRMVEGALRSVEQGGLTAAPTVWLRTLVSE